MPRLICEVCAKEYWRYPSQVTRACSMSCSRRRQWADPAYRRQMSEAHRGQRPWIAGRKHRKESIDKMRAAQFQGQEILQIGSGYLCRYLPDHPRAINGRVPEQIVIAERALGRHLAPHETVHHLNHVKTDNRNCNLVICTVRYHGWLHAKLSGLGVRIQSHNDRDPHTGRFIKHGRSD